MRERLNPTINAGSMADIAFLLLLFFLVATSIENPIGIRVVLPEYSETSVEIDESRVLTVQINKYNQVSVEDESVPIQSISEKVSDHIQQRLSINQQPILSLVTDTSATYDTYIAVYDEIKSAYHILRDQAALSQYNMSFELLNKQERASIKKHIPMIISESDHF